MLSAKRRLEAATRKKAPQQKISFKHILPEEEVASLEALKTKVKEREPEVEVIQTFKQEAEETIVSEIFHIQEDYEEPTESSDYEMTVKDEPIEDDVIENEVFL